MEEYMNNELGLLMKIIDDFADLDDEEIEQTLPAIKEQIKTNFTPEMREQSVNQLVKNLEDQRLNRQEAQVTIEAAKKVLKDMILLDDMTDAQKEISNVILIPFYDIFDEALRRFHLYNIELPMKLEEGAQVPTYAHDTDACADLYALEDTRILPETYGNKIRTGVSIQLPEGWVAMIFPRSSTGSKTTLRLSNSVGIIDSGYRGELGVLYDNTSVGTVEIKKGDRIAQLLVMPSYRFQAKVVESLEDSDRGEGGFGSTGA